MEQSDSIQSTKISFSKRVVEAYYTSRMPVPFNDWARAVVIREINQLPSKEGKE